MDTQDKAEEINFPINLFYFLKVAYNVPELENYRSYLQELVAIKIQSLQCKL